MAEMTCEKVLFEMFDLKMTSFRMSRLSLLFYYTLLFSGNRGKKKKMQRRFLGGWLFLLIFYCVENVFQKSVHMPVVHFLMES